MVSSLAVGQPKLNVISPLFALEQLESLFEFTMKTTNSLPPSRTSKVCLQDLLRQFNLI